ncbi:MAG: translational GTPase TypA [Deltaproteobacteria bacterium]|nr:translational GTPase TypA [Deltaproteobacteria bacterium]
MKNIQYNHAIRNIAIIAHVDHGKTTLVDAMFQQSGLYREGQKGDSRAMDRLDLEKERGITIAAKNCSVQYKDVKINILDTPGHADFGGEVERALSMVDGAILLVDASEGPLPQTRFVLEKALKSNLKIIVLINKIDRKDARIGTVVDEVYDLLIDLGASEEQLEFPLLYSIGKDGIAKNTLEEESQNLVPLFECILEEIPSPSFHPETSFQMLVADLGYSDFLGRLAIGKIINGEIKSNQALSCIGDGNKVKAVKASKLQVYEGMVLTDANKILAGDIAILAGLEDVKIGDTICSDSKLPPLKRIYIDEPTVSMRFYRNNSPLAGKEGKFIQSSKIFERLHKETLSNLAIQLEETEDRECFLVKGRGEFQMAILLETMRREGFELCLGRPEVIYRYENNKKLEPIEHLFVDCGEPFTGVVTEKLNSRKARMINLNNNGDRVRIEFSVPSRSLIGYRDEFLTDTKGTGIMNSYLSGYEEFRGEFHSRFTGSLVSDRQGSSVAYALFNLEPRGQLFIKAGEMVYEGMIIGEHNKDSDLGVNPTKEKKLSNMRASGKDESTVLSPITPMTLEMAIHFIKEDELVEVTPKTIRLRKQILDTQKRLQASSKKVKN